MKRSLITILSGMVVMAVMITACSKIKPQATPSLPTTGGVNAVGTAVAATMTAQPETSISPSPEAPGSHGITPETSAQTSLVTYINIDHNLYAWTPGATAFAQIAATGDIVQAYPSPDGTLVAFIRTTDYQSYSLDLVRSDGANHRTLFSHDQFQALPRPEGALDSAPMDLQWIPGTHQLAMTVRVVLQGPGSMIGKDLMVINADDGTAHTLLTESAGFTFAFSPDGTHIATSLADGINLYDASGHASAPVKFFGFPSVNTASEYQYMPPIQWALNSTAFAFFVPPIDPLFDNEGKTRVILVNARDASYTTPVFTKMTYLFPEKASPDLSQVAYTLITEPTGGVVDLHIASMDGTKDEVYLSGKKVSQFFWAPDSMHFLFAYNDGTNYIANLGAVGSSLAQIAKVSSMRDAAWVDSSHYLIVDKAAAGWTVWLGQVGSEPAAVYSDTTANDGYTSLSVNR